MGSEGNGWPGEAARWCFTEREGGDFIVCVSGTSYARRACSMLLLLLGMVVIWLASCSTWFDFGVFGDGSGVVVGTCTYLRGSLRCREGRSMVVEVCGRNNRIFLSRKTRDTVC